MRIFGSRYFGSCWNLRLVLELWYLEGFWFIVEEIVGLWALVLIVWTFLFLGFSMFFRCTNLVLVSYSSTFLTLSVYTRGYNISLQIYRGCWIGLLSVGVQKKMVPINDIAGFGALNLCFLISLEWIKS